MKSRAMLLMLVAVLIGVASSAYAYDVLTEDGVKCSYTHYDMWKGKMSGDGILFLGMNGGENEKIYLIWGKSRSELLQKDAYSLHEPEKGKAASALAWYQEFRDILRKAAEWDAAADANGLEGFRKKIDLGWSYNKEKKGPVGWISKIWGPPGKNEVIEINISEIPKLLSLLETVPDLERKFLDGIKKQQEDADKRKAEEKAKKDKVDSILK